jgi:hypothetical protein
MKPKKNIYYIDLFLSYNIFSLLFHVSHLIISWSLNTKNSLQLVDLFSGMGLEPILELLGAVG